MIEINWLGHMTFALRTETGEVTVLDPWIDGNPKFPAGHKFDRIDSIVITHGHYDHIGAARKLAAEFSPQVYANYEICTWLTAKGVKNCNGMNIGGTVQAGPIGLTMTTALHTSGITEDDGSIVYGGQPAGYVLHFADGRNAYFAGDTDVFGDMALIAEMHQPELAFLPIGDLFTMSPKGAAIATRLLKVKKVIPMHYGTFPPLTGRPEQLAALTQTEVWPLEIGVPIRW